MNKLKKLFFVFFVFILLSTNIYATGTNTDDKYRLIIPDSDAVLHFYYFSYMDNCFTCQHNIKLLSEVFNDKVNFVLIISAIDDNAADLVKKSYNADINSIGDPYSIYRDYYDVTHFPYLIVLNKDGKKLKSGVPGSEDVAIKKLQVIYNQELQTHNQSLKMYSNLTEVKRIPVTNDNSPFLSGKIHRDIISNSDRNLFFLRDNMRPTLYMIDSIGHVSRIIDRNKYPNFYGSTAHNSLSWVVPDSILFMFSTVRGTFEAIYQLYDFVADSLYPHTVFKPKFSEKRDWYSNNNRFIHEHQLFYNYFNHRTTMVNNDELVRIPFFKLNDKDTALFLYDILYWFSQNWRNGQKNNVWHCH